MSRIEPIETIWTIGVSGSDLEGVALAKNGENYIFTFRRSQRRACQERINKLEREGIIEDQEAIILFEAVEELETFRKII